MTPVDSTHHESSRGLSSAEAAERLDKFGPNALPEKRRHPLLAFLVKFWGPVPWMLEVAVILELVLHKTPEAIIIAALLIFNAILSLFQESRAQNALALLRRRLEVQARVMRDGEWRTVAARELVPGDLIHIRMGDLVPADLLVTEGLVTLDQSALTGESLPVEVEKGGSAYSGTTVSHGEATGEVTATGARTSFGKTAELVATAKTAGHLASLIFSIVKYLIAFDAVLIVILLIYAPLAGLPLSEMLPFVLILLIASVPVALPSTFTLATALGSRELAGSGVLVTRLSAIEEAAAMDVLCADKTGTITENRLEVAVVTAFSSRGEDEVLHLAALASDDATQDPIDMAILALAGARGLVPTVGEHRSMRPFDPATKRSEALIDTPEGPVRIVKGAPRAVAGLATPVPGLDAEVERLSSMGNRVLAVASGPQEPLDLVGLVALRDPPRTDSAVVLERLRELGLRIVMITGDGLATAKAVATEVRIGGGDCLASSVREQGIDVGSDCGVIAQVYPEDKFHVVEAFQRGGHVTGMTGDGVNDAPALKQAEVGVAVANATDVAKAAASLVLTNPGLSDVPAAVETSRRIYQRMLTYTLNKVIKTFQIALFLSLGVLLTHSFVITPLLIVLLLFLNDFVTMSVATDRVSFSAHPDRWRVRVLMSTGFALALLVLAFSFGVLFTALDALHLDLLAAPDAHVRHAGVHRARQHLPGTRARPPVDITPQPLADGRLLRGGGDRRCASGDRHAHGVHRARFGRRPPSGDGRLSTHRRPHQDQDLPVARSPLMWDPLFPISPGPGAIGGAGRYENVARGEEITYAAA